MIAFVDGLVEDLSEENVVLDVGGIGVNVRISTDTAARLPGRGERIRLYTYTAVREDAFWLYGFLSRSELDFFKKCITVSGIGPKVAMGLLSAMDVDSLRFAILSGDAKAIAKAPGVGNRTAERLILELKDKLAYDDTMIRKEIAAGDGGGLGLSLADSPQKREALEALVSLGYGRAESLKALNAVEHIETMDSGAVLKAALKHMF